VTTTEAFVLCVTALVSAWTYWHAHTDRYPLTVSATIRRWAASHPVVAYALGVLCGHWLAPAVTSPEWGGYALLACGAGMLAGAIARPTTLRMWQVSAVFVGGLIAGGVLWSQPVP
jgi:hypothetical protein